MKRRAWTQAEITLLKRYYRAHGPRTVQTALARHGFERSISNIRHKASALGVPFGVCEGYVPLNVVHPITSSNFSAPSLAAIKRAKADGVLVTRKSGRKRIHTVPIAWADAYASELGDRYQVDQLEGVWPRTKEVAVWFGIDPQYLLNARCVDCGFLSELVRGVETRRGTRNQLLWHPEQARMASVRYKREYRPRDKRKLSMSQARWVRRERASGRSMRSLAVELGVSVGTVQHILDGRTYREPELGRAA